MGIDPREGPGPARRPIIRGPPEYTRDYNEQEIIQRLSRDCPEIIQTYTSDSPEIIFDYSEQVAIIYSWGSWQYHPDSTPGAP